MLTTSQATNNNQNENKILNPFIRPCILIPNLVPNDSLIQQNYNSLIFGNIQIPVAYSSALTPSFLKSLEINQNLQNFLNLHSIPKMSQNKKSKVLKGLTEYLNKKMIINTRFTKNQKKMIHQYNFSINMISNSNEQYASKSPNEIKRNRIPFSIEEDEKIKRLVDKFGKRKWRIIASFMKGRTPKQCRDRYCNYLFPGYFRGEWSKEEDDLLVKLYSEVGPKWSVIKKSFIDRSANSLKNRWKYFLSRQNKKEKEENQSEDESYDDDESDIVNFPINDTNFDLFNKSNNQNESFEEVYNNSNNEDDWILF